jgi:membrane associated rhomboid family serine protease
MNGRNILFGSERGGFFKNLSVTWKLIIINVICFFISFLLLGIYGEDFFTNNLALTPSLILQGKAVWTLLTSMFVHAGFFHLFANMFSLFFVGTFLERIIGRKRFFWIYIFSGLVGGFFYIISSLIFGGLSTPAVGASGAIFGLLGVLAILVPRSKIYLITGPLILIIADALASSLLPAGIASIIDTIVNILILVMIFSLFSFNSVFRKFSLPINLPMWALPIIAIVPLTIISIFIPLPIGNSAHFGGLVTGLLYGFYLRRKFPKKVRRLGNIFV